MRTVCVLLTVLTIAGCALIDQTTFAPSPEAPVDVSKLPQADPRTALLTIGYATPNPNYQEMLRYAVRSAETRAPGVQYDIVGVMPGGADAAVAQQHAEAVMRDIMAQGVPASRIHLGLRSAQAGAPEEVRVYVR